MLAFLTQARTMIIALALVSAAAGMGYVSHKLIVLKKDTEIARLQTEITQLRANVETLKNNQQIYEDAARQNQQTLESLRARIQEQATQAADLGSRVQRLSQEKQEYMSIFRRHDLSNLARARPGLIESRVNSGSAQVLDGLEQESRK